MRWQSAATGATARTPTLNFLVETTIAMGAGEDRLTGDEAMRIWISKYALSVGIKEVDAEIDDRLATWREFGHTQYAHGDEWQPNYGAALKRAEAMRLKRIASLRKQITKLEALSFGGDGD